MKRLVTLLCLLGASCEPSVKGGKIIGKFKSIDHYYLQLDRDGTFGDIKVTEKAWNQAAKGMEWPFEVK